MVLVMYLTFTWLPGFPRLFQMLRVSRGILFQVCIRFSQGMPKSFFTLEKNLLPLTGLA